MTDRLQNKLRIKFLGAIGTVTGSCTLLEYSVPNKLYYYLVDVGLYQNENNPYNIQKVLKSYAPKLSKIFITHAHLDHIGFLPDLVNYGFRGEVWCTKATKELMKVMLEDAIKIQSPDILPNSIIKKINFNCIDDEEKHKFGFQIFPIPLATGLCVTISRSAHILGSASFNFMWNEQAETDVPLKDWTQHIYFSGDIGPVSAAHIPNILFKGHHIPWKCPEHKYIVLESTYGNQKHDNTEYTFDKRIEKLQGIIEEALMKGQTILIPAFALDRAQQLLVDLYYWTKYASNEFKKFYGKSLHDDDYNFFQGNKQETIDKVAAIGEAKSIKKEKVHFDDLPQDLQEELVTGWTIDWNIIKKEIDIVSPLINKINKIYINNLPDDIYYTTLKEFGYKYLSDRFRFNLVNNHVEKEYSKENHRKEQEKIKKILGAILNFDCEETKKDKNKSKTIQAPTPHKKIIIAASGMCDEGSVVDLLKKYIPDDKVTVILTGFQAKDTNGRILRELNSFDEDYKNLRRLHNVGIRLSDIKCEIISELIPYYSAHADQSQLVDYINDVVKDTPQTTVFLNHGTDNSRTKLKEEIEKKYNHEEIKVSVELPLLNQWINLNTGEIEIEEVVPAPVNNNTLKYFNINNIHLYLPAAYNDNKISEIINFLLKQ